LFATAAAAQKAYKCVDEKGSTVYSQTPCVTGSEAQVDISPAHKSRGGYTGRSPYDDPRTVSRESAQQQYKDEAYRRQKAQEEARQKRLAELQAECNRNRGTDCNNPQALRYQESQNIPGGYRR
jgi:hypothetical protein